MNNPYTHMLDLRIEDRADETRLKFGALTDGSGQMLRLMQQITTDILVESMEGDYGDPTYNKPYHLTVSLGADICLVRVMSPHQDSPKHRLETACVAIGMRMMLMYTHDFTSTRMSINVVRGDGGTTKDTDKDSIGDTIIDTISDTIKH